MEKRSRRRFTNEFKAETVALIRQSGKIDRRDLS
jgi:transposase-like protein